MQMLKFPLPDGSWKTHKVRVSSKSDPEICMLELLKSNKQQRATSVSVPRGLGFVCEDIGRGR